MRFLRRISVPLAVAAVIAPAQAASASVYCVTQPSAPPGCSGTTETSLADALSAAGADTTGSDQIVLPVGEQTDVFPYVYSGTVPLEIDGQSSGITAISISSGLNSGAVLSDQDKEPSLTLRHLTLQVPAGSDPSVDGIDFGPGVTANLDVVSIDNLGDATIANAIVLDHGALTNVDVGSPPSGGFNFDTAVEDGGGGASLTISDSNLFGATYALETFGAHQTIVHRTQLSSGAGDALYEQGGTTTIDDSLLSSTANSAIGASAAPGDAGPSEVQGTQLTVTRGDVAAQSQNGSPFGASVQLTDSILLGSIYALKGTGATDPASVSTDYSDYDPTEVHVSGGGTHATGAHDVTMYLDPMFRNPSAGDFQLLAGSPVIAYDRTPLRAGESASDLAGSPRITGGARDLGAYQHQPPTVLASVKASPVRAGAPASFTAAGQAAYLSDPLSYSWSFDDGASATGAVVAHAFNHEGTHLATVTVTDQRGFQAKASVTVAVLSAPLLARLRESNRRWRRGSALAHLTAARRPPVGTTFSFKLDQRATVTLRFAQVRGRHRGTITRVGHAGTDRISFDGRLDHGRLASGNYRATITARNVLGLGSRPESLSFTIVR